MSPHDLSIRLDDQTLRLCPERCLMWEEERTLILSDLHLGKSIHFQRRGIPLPVGAQEATLARLDSVLDRLRPSRVVMLGDLFHSRLNTEWLDFAAWRRQWDMPFTLVMGNHDILHPQAYEMADLERTGSWRRGCFDFVHDPMQAASSHGWTLCGHVHPRVTIRLKGRLSARRPCFHLSDRMLTLPAFGDQTGGHTIRPGKEDRTFIITDGAVIEFHHQHRIHPS